MEEQLTKQDKTFVEEIIKTGNKTRAAKKAYKYKNNNTAGVMALDKLRKPKIQKAIQDAIPDDLLTERHLELLNKREVFVVGGELIDRGPEVQAVSKGLDMAYKLKGSYAPEKTINANMNVSVDIEEKANEAISRFLNK